MDEEGVSPVVATILLVAITVVLAATAFVLVGTDDHVPPEVPRLSFEVDHSGPGAVLTVVSVKGDSGQTYWERVAVADTSTAACTLPTGQMRAGDRIACTEGRLVLVYQVSAGDAVLLYDEVLR